MSIREINAQDISNAVAQLCIEANCHLPKDVQTRIEKLTLEETFPVAKNILEDIITNYKLADNENLPICQDTGMACVFIEIGQDVHINGNVNEAIHEGVRIGYKDGFLRKSVVGDPLERINTKDNTPAMIYTSLCDGDKVKITVAPKGFGSENMSQIKMLRPSDGVEGVKEFVLKVVEDAGPNPCPPMVVGVGIGGTFDKCALMAKEALLNDFDYENPDKFYADLEKELLCEINKKGIGPQGFGGKTTALSLSIKTLPTHIAGLPCAVNINCHVSRHKSCVI